jgi:hypothetical protein
VDIGKITTHTRPGHVSISTTVGVILPFFLGAMIILGDYYSVKKIFRWRLRRVWLI